MAIVRTGFDIIFTSGVEDPVSSALSLGTNPGRAVVAFMSIGNAYSVISASVTGGDALTQIDVEDLDGFKRYYFAGVVSQSGSQTITFNTDAPTGQGKWGQVASYDGVGSFRAGGFVSSGASGTQPSISLSGLTADDVLVMLGISNGAGASLSAAGGATDFDGGAADSIALEKIATAASETINGTWSAPSAWYAGAVALAPITAPDTTPPTLTTPTGTQTGATTATGTVSTNEGNGTLYRLASTNATETAATVVAAALSQAVTATGVQNVTFTGLTASTVYYAHYVHDDAAANRSARVSSSSFTTATPGAATAVTLSGPSTGTVGAPSTNFTVGANGTISGSITVTPSAAGCTFVPTSVVISSSSTTATFMCVAASTGAKSITLANTGSLSNPATFTYTASAGGIFTSEPLKRNNTTLVANTTLNYVTLYDDSTGALVVRQTGLNTNSSGIFIIGSSSIVPGTTYKVDWESSTGQRKMPRKAAT